MRAHNGADLVGFGEGRCLWLTVTCTALRLGLDLME
jgi:hypothetical protein